MGLLNFFAERKALTATPAVVEALQDRRINPYIALGGTNQRVTAAYQRGIDGSYGWIYSTQPAVRAIVDFVARNVAQLALKCYERVGDTERERREDHPAARTMADPDGKTPADAFIYRLVSDYLIYDNAYVLKLEGTQGKRTLIRLPPSMVQVAGGRFQVDSYTVWRYDGSYFSVPPEAVMHWYGYNPEDPLLGLSKLETLRQELATDRATQAALVELAKSGLKGGYIKRPLEAPEWDQDDAERFAEQWRAQKVRKDGGDPILDEGMSFEEVGVSPKDAEIIASRQFTKSEVAAVYGVPLAALGAEGNTAEERRLVYADVLPPITNALSCQLDVDLLRAEYNAYDFYFEFDLNSKLQGDLENRFPALTASAGRPWQTVNEVRAKENMPPIDGGDELTIPLNVALAGDQGSITNPQLPAPNVMPPQDPNAPPQDGSYRETPKKALEVTTAPRRLAAFRRQQANIEEVKRVVDRFVARQMQTVKSQKGAFDTRRWNREFKADVLPLIRAIFKREGDLQLAHLAGGEFDEALVHNYTDVMAEDIAKNFNEANAKRIADFGTDAYDWIKGEHASITATSIGARATTKARVEAGKQSPSAQHRLQTWIADTDRHADLDGVSVPLDSDWGGISPGSEANCACSASIS